MVNPKTEDIIGTILVGGLFIFILIKYIIPLILITIVGFIIPGLIVMGIGLIIQYFNKN